MYCSGRRPSHRSSFGHLITFDSSIQEDPPTLDREGGVYKYSRAFKDVVDSCLVKDPSKRFVVSEYLLCSPDSL